MKILAVVTNGFEDVEAIGTIALLRRSKLEVEIVSLHDHKAEGKYGFEINNVRNLNEVNLNDYDMLFVPGGPEYVEFSKSQELLKTIIFFANNKALAGICAAPTIFGALGLLKNKKYTCFTSMNQDFGGQYIDKYAVTDGNIVTGRSAAAIVDFAFNIVELLLGKDHANKIKDSIYY